MGNLSSPSHKMMVTKKYAFEDIINCVIVSSMNWTVIFHDAFDAEFSAFSSEVQDAFLAKAGLLKIFGPQLGRPHVDTLNDSKHTNMKELRFDAAGGVWRVAFAFDTLRQAIILVAGDKSGGSEKRFYRSLIATADKRLDDHLAQQKKGS
ncbi:MAG: type II toxin-antitoxin system RelE/ParE family toxin [Magnetococcus sp. YQC-5]